MTALSFLRISPDTEIIRDKNGDLSLTFKESHYAGNDYVPPELLGYVAACVTRDYGGAQHWPELARQFIQPREKTEVQGVNRASPA
jgi:hypothetical protein